MVGAFPHFVAALAAASTLLLAHPADAALRRRANIQPVMGGTDFPDPSVIRTGDGWHAFSTNSAASGKQINVPMAYTPDFKTWTYRGTKDAMPKLAPWVNSKAPKVWAPDVSQLPDGSFIMYYTASLAKTPATHCLGYATSKNVEGPYVDNAKNAWICPTKQGGAIDPSGFLDQKTGKRYIVYKVDGNSIGHGGDCGNTVAPIVPTPILLQQLSPSNGHDLIGSPIELIKNGPADGPYVEAPSLTYLNGKYVLFFSSQCYATPKYDVSYAISNSLAGPYVKYGPLFVTGTLGLTAPGGLDIAVNGDHAVFHAYVNLTNGRSVSSPQGLVDAYSRTDRLHDSNYRQGRAMFTAILSLNGNTVSART